MTVRAHFNAIAIPYIGYGYGWRFSVARQVIAATSGRVQTGGDTVQRCPLHLES
ncbi:hypothetical protein OR573_04545 [Halomonas sp. CH40]